MICMHAGYDGLVCHQDISQALTVQNRSGRESDSPYEYIVHRNTHLHILLEKNELPVSKSVAVGHHKPSIT